MTFKIYPKNITAIKWTHLTFKEVSKPYIIFGIIGILLLWIFLIIAIEFKFLGANQEFQELRGLSLLISIFIICGIIIFLIIFIQFTDLKHNYYKSLPNSILMTIFFKKLKEFLFENSITFKEISENPIIIGITKFEITIVEEYHGIIKLRPYNTRKYKQLNIEKTKTIVDEVINECLKKGEKPSD